MSALKAGCLAALVAVAMVLSGCAKTKPRPVVMQVLAKPNRLGQEREASEEAGLDDGTDYEEPAVFRKDLPLAGTKWEWEGNLSPDHFEALDEPSRYSLEFKANGWFDFRADCKHGAGMYEANGDRIALAVIKASRPACRTGSKAGDFLGALEKAKFFRQAESKLYFELKTETKMMVFGFRP